MKNLMVFASAVLVSASAFAATNDIDYTQGTTPRVYEYSANLTTTVAKNAAKVTYKGVNGTVTDLNVCYRVKGSVSVKGVAVFGCNCVGAPVDMYEGYPIFMLGTSADKYTRIVFAEEAELDVAARLGNPLSSKATVAELGFGLEFEFGPTNECGREFYLYNAGFGSASTLDKAEGGLDISSISGNVVGAVTPPHCSAQDNNCPRCVANDECDDAIAFFPCTVIDPYEHDLYGEDNDRDVAYGSFSLKFNKSLSTLIKPILPEEIQLTINALVPKVFGKNAKAPVYEVQ